MVPGLAPFHENETLILLVVFFVSRLGGTRLACGPLTVGTIYRQYRLQFACWYCKPRVDLLFLSTGEFYRRRSLLFGSERGHLHRQPHFLPSLTSCHGRLGKERIVNGILIIAVGGRGPIRRLAPLLFGVTFPFDSMLPGIWDLRLY
ncbi:hypothetical protein B0H66DRAFT_570328 [Apodospora peruviana]|uniref:Uncharacterized protein n=1 Tax=Apodospora peruviana TaxID=516989 RepID=A0AAE0LY75_9PEZI|nr:hypothetical protein B0H66DRAFT_570328 [Apodospora peruviana]